MSDNEETLVLVADDEPSTLALITAHVRSKGFKVVEASDGDMAWQLAHEHLPDLVILDVMMPGMSGWEVCRKIRESLPLAHTGVIMLTGIGEHLNEMTSPLYGADAHVDKPFEFSDLDEKIEQTLAARREGSFGRPDGADEEDESAAEERAPVSDSPDSGADDDDDSQSPVHTQPSPPMSSEEAAPSEGGQDAAVEVVTPLAPKKKAAKKKAVKKASKKKEPAQPEPAQEEAPAKKASKKAAKKAPSKKATKKKARKKP